MFSADLTWIEGGRETVGERRARRAQEKAHVAPSVKTTNSSRSSDSTTRGFTWMSGLKKAKELKPSNKLRSSSSRSLSSSTADQSIPQKLRTNTLPCLKDPSLQPAWTYQSSLSTTLPSGASLDLPKYEVPEFDVDASSRRTKSILSRASYEHRWELKTPVRAKNIGTPKQTSPESYATAKTRASSEVSERKDSLAIPCIDTDNKRIESRLSTTITEENLSIPFHDDGVLKNNVCQPIATDSTHQISPSTMMYRPLSQWVSLTPQAIPQMKAVAKPKAIKTVTRSSNTETTRFQQFIGGLEGAGPQLILSRLKETLQELPDKEDDEEAVLEKQLWLLTGYQVLNVGKAKFTPKPNCETGRILELYGNLSEVYQISAMSPQQMVHFLTTNPQRSLPLPGNVSYLTVREHGTVPLPYPENYFSHIRASTLPSLVPSAKLPELFHECYKLLAPGGLLEIRIMDAAPLRTTAGPKMRTWIEDRLSVNLERLFRCSRPCFLVPGWLKAAGFELTVPEGDENVKLPCVFDKTSPNVNEELSTMIGNALWKDVWGGFVDDVPCEPKWWWENEEIVQECLERKTVFECRAIFAYKT